MIISWLGDSGLRIQTKDATVIIDPPAASTGLKPGKLTADIVAVTTADRRDASLVQGTNLSITTPGEYELKQIFIYGIALPSDTGRVHFRIEAEGMSLGHLADLDHKLENGELEQLEGVDVLFIPVGGKTVLDAETAATIISQIEPRIVVPIQYATPGAKLGYGAVDLFLKELGGKQQGPESKWKITKKDLPAEETQVVLLQV